MPQASKAFRIFVSSTFSDLKEERNALQKYVFPRLRELCMRHGCRFQAIDLRWGVSEEASRDQQTMKICLEEIKRCRRVTPRPNFIVLLGDRYGWRPLPTEIPKDEFDLTLDRVSDEERALLLWDEQQPPEAKGWYREDKNALHRAQENAEPQSVYCLQPRGKQYADYSRWEKVESRLRWIFEQATEDIAFQTEDGRAKYVTSATEQEIMLGALKVPDADEHVHCFFRNIKNGRDLSIAEELPKDAAVKDFVDVAANDSFILDGISHQRLDDLKQRLRAQIPQNIHTYDARWKGDPVGADDVDSPPSPISTDHIGALPESLDECLKLIDEPAEQSCFCVDVWRRLARVILDQIQRLESITAEEKEEKDHEDFGKLRAEHFTGRASYLEAISDYIKGDDAHTLALYGESGSGKSALMAKAIADANDEYPSAVIVQRFIGATPSSSDGRALLESLCKEINSHYGEDEQSVPAEYQKLVKDFQKRLELATQDKPLIIFLDALDQLLDNEHARDLAWLPNKLPPHVHVIVSTLPSECLTQLEQKLPTPNLLKLDPMTSSEGDELLDLWLADAKRRLEPAQRESVLKEFRVNGLPLYLKLAFEEARRWKSYSLAQRFPADIPGMIRAMFRRLMSDHGHMLIERAMGYIAAARHGLSEDELLDVLSMDKEVFDDFLERAHHKPPEQRLPVVVWSRLYFDLEPYLTERNADGASLLGFYHRQLGEVVTGEFLAGEAKRERHIALAKFFAGQDYFLETLEAQRERARRLPPTARPANLRKASELAWQLLCAKQWEQLEQLLTNLLFLEAKAEAGMVFDLVSDFSAAVKLINAEHAERGMLLVLEEAVRRDIHFIARHPTTLFQCLWNSCWWYDCPKAARHYGSGEAQLPRMLRKLLRLRSSRRSKPRVHDMLEAWHAARERNLSGYYWVRSLRPPTMNLGTAQRAVLRGHQDVVGSVSISADGQRIVSGSSDKTVRVWDAESGEELRCLSGHNESVRSTSVSSDGRRIVGAIDNTLRVWDLELGEEVRRLALHDESVHSVRISCDGRKIVGAIGKTVRVWDLESGQELHCMRGHEDSVNSVAISADGHRIVSGSGRFYSEAGDNTVRVWDAQSGEELRCLRGHKSTVRSVAISTDGRRVVSGAEDDTVRVWDAESGKELHCLRAHKSKVNSVGISSDGRRIVSGSHDKTVRVWDAESGEELRCLGGHEESVNSVAICANGRTIVSGSGGSLVSVDNTVRVWDSGSWDGLRRLRGHKDFVFCVAISADGRRIVSGSKDCTVRIWDARSGEELRCLRAHEESVYGIAISTDGCMVVSGGGDGTVRVWDATSGVELRCLRGHDHVMVNSVAISSDKSWIVSGSWDYTVRVWDPESGAELRCLRGHKDYVGSVAISADGRRIVSASDDNTVRVWDRETGQCLEVIEGQHDVHAVASGPVTFPFRAIAQGPETVIEDTTGQLMSLFPVHLYRLAVHPSGRLWAGASGNHVYIIALEGGPEQNRG